MGSLFSALTTAVSGLNAQSSAIGNISDNLANAQTTGYKSVGTNFEELVNASNAAVNNPGGVKATPQYQNDVQGSITASNIPTSLAISGAGYFAVQTASTNSAGVTTFSGTTLYTRQGDFTLDKSGYFVNGSGYYLTGYSIDSVGAVNTSTTAPIQISALQNDPVPASVITYAANLPSNAATGYVAPTSTVQIIDSLGDAQDANYTWTKTGTNTWSLDVSIPNGLDSNGNPYNAIIPYTFNDGTSGTTAGTIKTIGAYSQPAASFTINNAPTTGTFKIGSASVAYSQLGPSVSTSGNTAVTVTDSSGATQTVNVAFTTNGSTAADVATNLAAVITAMHSANYTTASATSPSSGKVTLSFGISPPVPVTPDSGGTSGDTTWSADSWAGPLATIDGTNQETPPSAYGAPNANTAGNAAAFTIDATFPGTSVQTLSLNFGTYGGSTGVTQFSDTNSTVSVSNFSQNGLPKGSFNSISIDKDGFVSLNYSNGTNKQINQIPIAQFYAQDQLQRVTGGAYTTQLASGNARLSAPGVQGAGTISANSLEQSNVDIATQFTDLIQAQQVYSANSKLITTDNSLLQVTLSMIQ